LYFCFTLIPNVLASTSRYSPNVKWVDATNQWLAGRMSEQCSIFLFFPPPNVLSNHRRNKPNVHCTYPMTSTQCHPPNVIHSMSYPMSFTQCTARLTTQSTQCHPPNAIHPMSYPMSFTQCTARLTTQSTQCHPPNVIHPMSSTQYHS
jgi:hypothetical protein